MTGVSLVSSATYGQNLFVPWIYKSILKALQSGCKPKKQMQNGFRLYAARRKRRVFANSAIARTITTRDRRVTVTDVPPVVRRYRRNPAPTLQSFQKAEGIDEVSALKSPGKPSSSDMLFCYTNGFFPFAKSFSGFKPLSQDYQGLHHARIRLRIPRSGAYQEVQLLHGAGRLQRNR